MGWNEQADCKVQMDLDQQVYDCTLCPRMCHVNRQVNKGYCQAPATITAARAALHQWEEPCISGFAGSGAVFFSGCSLRCRFCQNYTISQDGFGKSISATQLGDIFLRLQEEGAHNINLVTATPYLPEIIKALDLVKPRLHIPVVYNTGGYERLEVVQALKDYVDIWLPDLKYFDSQLSWQFSQAKDYFEVASAAITQMIKQTGAPSFHKEIPTADGVSGDYTDTHSGVCTDSGDYIHSKESSRVPTRLMDRGVIIRHLVLPGHRDDSIAILKWIAQNLPKDQFMISLMSQYTPYHHDDTFPELNRRITSYEYNLVVDTALELGLDLGFMQKKSSAKEEYTPPFDLEGLPT